ncbi:MAG: hypothetical protein AB7P17_02715 [Nitrospirales bacterium]|nr:hypothetical protein [Nitrospirales bacterium]
MTATIPSQGIVQPTFSFWVMGVLMLLPALLAAGTLDNPLHHSSLPDKDSYRSPLSETLLESNRWRIPQEEKRDWRLPPPPPPIGWRTPQTSQSETSSSQRTLELFPKYQPGKQSNYDFNEREEKPLIKMFEFGSK